MKSQSLIDNCIQVLQLGQLHVFDRGIVFGRVVFEVIVDLCSEAVNLLRLYGKMEEQARQGGRCGVTTRNDNKGSVSIKVESCLLGFRWRRVVIFKNEREHIRTVRCRLRS